MMSEREDRPTGPAAVQKPMSCEEFQAQMPALMGGDENIHDHDHLATCVRCNALIEELEEIGRAARYLLNPDYDPPTLTWEDVLNRGAKEVTLRDDHTSVHMDARHA